MTTEAYPYLTLPIRSEEEALGGKWRPIETAPKSGCILCTAGYGPSTWGPGGWIEIGVWTHRLRGEGRAWHNGAMTHEIHPTHWMPLPAPPHTEGGREG